MWKLSKYSTSCPGYISKIIHWSGIINPQKDKACIEGVQRRDFARIDEKLKKWQTFQIS